MSYFDKFGLVHYRPLAEDGNVRCLNGDAHARYSDEIKYVTCPLCLDPNHKKTHWDIVREEIRTKHMYSPITGKKFERYL